MSEFVYVGDCPVCGCHRSFFGGTRSASCDSCGYEVKEPIKYLTVWSMDGGV
jgi:hypothetical protein